MESKTSEPRVGQEKVVVLLSGGLDSSVLLHLVVRRLLHKAVALNIFYGQRHQIEIECAKTQCRLLGNVDLVDIDLSAVFGGWPSALTNDNIKVPNIKDVLGHPQPPTYVPNRNMIFLSVAAGYAEAIGATKVYYGAQLHDEYGYWDTTPEFVRRMNAVAQLNRMNQIEIIAPLAKNKKSDNIRLGVELGVDFGYTHSCYDPKLDLSVECRVDEIFKYVKNCGVCPTCSERLKGFKEIGISDPRLYIGK